MIGCIRWGSSDIWWPRWEEGRLGKLPCMNLSLPPKAKQRRVLRGAQGLYQRGVRRAIAPAGFSRWDLLAKEGVRPVDQSGLCQALAPQLVLTALASQGVDPKSATVALRGGRMTTALRNTALALCPQVGRLMITVPSGGQMLRQQLWRQFGLPDWEEPTQHSPHVALHFAPMPGEGEEVFRLYGAVPDLGTCRLTCHQQPIPEGLEEGAVLSALWEHGKLELGQIEIYTSSPT